MLVPGLNVSKPAGYVHCMECRLPLCPLKAGTSTPVLGYDGVAEGRPGPGAGVQNQGEGHGSNGTSGMSGMSGAAGKTKVKRKRIGKRKRERLRKKAAGVGILGIDHAAIELGPPRGAQSGNWRGKGRGGAETKPLISLHGRRDGKDQDLGGVEHEGGDEKGVGGGESGEPGNWLLSGFPEREEADGTASFRKAEIESVGRRIGSGFGGWNELEGQSELKRREEMGQDEGRAEWDTDALRKAFGDF